MTTTAAKQTPPLENGDRLDAAEFLRRYHAMPRVKKAELIDGVVFMPSPVRRGQHAEPHSLLVWLLVSYQSMTPGVVCGDNGTVLLDDANAPQPDADLRVLPTHGGQAAVTPDDYLDGAPELVAEVAASSASIDLGSKLRLYQRHGAREYVVWRVLEGEIDWFVFRGGAFARATPDAGGRYRSEAFPGLWVDPAALTAGDLAGALAALRQGVASPEHAAFAARLAQNALGKGGTP